MKNIYPSVTTIVDRARGLFDLDSDGYPINVQDVHPEYVRGVVELVSHLTEDGPEMVEAVLGLNADDKTALDILRERLSR